MKLKHKLFLLYGFITVFGFSIIISLFVSIVHTKNDELREFAINEMILSLSKKVESDMTENSVILRTLSCAFQSVSDDEHSSNLYITIMMKIAEHYSDISGVWTILDNSYKDKLENNNNFFLTNDGNYASYIYKLSNENTIVNDNAFNNYADQMLHNYLSIVPEIVFSYHREKRFSEKNAKIISIFIPILNNNIVTGLIGLDVDVEVLEYGLGKTNRSDGLQVFIADENGNMIVDLGVEKGISSLNYFVSEEDIVDFKRTINSGRKWRKQLENESIIICKPLAPENTLKQLSICVHIPSDYLIGRFFTSINILIIACISIMIASLFMFAKFANRFRDAMLKIVTTSNAFSTGSFLLQELDSVQNRKDEVGLVASSMKKSLTKVKNVIELVNNDSIFIQNKAEELANTSSIVSSGISAVAESSQEVAEGANSQASSISELNSIFSKVLMSTENNALNAKDVELSTFNIMDSSKDLLEIINSVFEGNKDIAVRIGLIDEIAIQLDILCLNANMEATRAGNYGKGFYVIANEINEISNKIKLISKDIQAYSNDTLQQAELSENTIKEIKTKISENLKSIQTILKESISQNSKITNVDKLIRELNSIVTKDASLAEEFSSVSEDIVVQSNNVAEASEYLSKLSESLIKNILFFKVKDKDEK